MVMHHHFNINNKHEVFSFLINKEGEIPEIILKQPLLKLQGSAQQGNYCENKNSWWHKLISQ